MNFMHELAHTQAEWSGERERNNSTRKTPGKHELDAINLFTAKIESLAHKLGRYNHTALNSTMDVPNNH
ncbi:hypothetical protein SESBI_40119 [Sesbania bispinosa]|nr:hypothetical protein SESBI_40119 [Sesbania bispinosa]